MAPLFSTGSHSRSLKRFWSIVLWPLASTTTLARTSSVRAVLVLDPHADGPVALEEHFQHAGRLVHLDAVLAGVVEHHRVELAADAPARSASTRAACCRGSRTGPTSCPLALTNCTLYFLTNWLAFILSSMLSRLKHPVRLGDQRLADVEARELVALEELDLVGPAGRGAWRRWCRPGRRRSTTTSALWSRHAFA